MYLLVTIWKWIALPLIMIVSTYQRLTSASQRTAWRAGLFVAIFILLVGLTSRLTATPPMLLLPAAAAWPTVTAYYPDLLPQLEQLMLLITFWRGEPR